MRADVAIVGAGLFGSSLAVALAREGMRVELYDKATPASGDTGRSFGMVRAHYSNEVTVRLAKRGIHLLAGDRRSGYVRTGYLLPVGERDRAACERNVELGRSLGVDSRMLDPPQVGEVEPALRTDGIAAAAYEPDGGLVDPGRMTLAWFAEALSLGVQPRLGAEVTDLGTVDAGTVVVAAGGWTSRLLPDLPISLKRIDVARVRPLRVSVVVSDTVTNVVVRPGVGDLAWAVAYREPEGYADRDEAPDAPEASYRESVARALCER
jgi:sarcosine oxidase, subunit beta